jgi:ankyrin repeat protein
MKRLLHAGTFLILVLSAGLPAAQSPSALADAVRRGDHMAVQALVRKGADVNVREADGTTPLHWAVRGNDVKLVSALVRAGADVKAKNRYGLQPLTLAATNGSAPIIDLLLTSGADPNERTAAGEPVLMTASRTGTVEAVKLLLGRGADVHARESWFGETALMWAAAENHASVVRLLVEAGADINARSTILSAPVLGFPRSGGPNSPLPRGGWTALMFAAREGAIDAATALADLGADLNATALPQTDVPLKADDIAAAGQSDIGTTAMVFAIINSHYDLASMLLDKGADPNVLDGSGMGALYAAVDMNSLQWVQGRPAPILRDRFDAVDLVPRLLQKGADPNARLKTRPLKRHHDAGSTLNFGEGTTPLMRAARTNDVAVMKLLLDAGADPFLTLPDRTDALMIAAGVGYGGLRGEGIRIVVPTPEGAIEALSLLLDRGMDVDAFNTAGNTALHGAVGRGDDVVRFLASRGAKLDLKNKAGFTPLDLALGRGGRRGRGGVVRESTAELLRRLAEDRDATTKAALR